MSKEPTQTTTKRPAWLCPCGSNFEVKKGYYQCPCCHMVQPIEDEGGASGHAFISMGCGDDKFLDIYKGEKP